jgi:hypothetical protein
MERCAHGDDVIVSDGLRSMQDKSLRLLCAAIGLVVPTSGVAACNALVGNEERGTDDSPDIGLVDSGALQDGTSSVIEATLGEPRDDGSSFPGTADATDGADAPTDTAPVYVGCRGEAACERVIFVTSQSFAGGAIGGLEGGDAKCQAVANASSNTRIKNREFLAWLSTSATHARDRHVAGTQPYRRANGTTLLASSFQDLLNSGLQASIANENDVVTGEGAWTGTKNDGTRTNDTCGDWTSTAATGTTGDPDQPSTWSEDPGAVACDSTDAIICIER